jgi:hypothetical protein
LIRYSSRTFCSSTLYLIYAGSPFEGPRNLVGKGNRGLVLEGKGEERNGRIC